MVKTILGIILRNHCKVDHMYQQVKKGSGRSDYSRIINRERCGPDGVLDRPIEGREQD